jgi:hypothetical protein
LRRSGSARLGAATGARLDHRAVRFEGGEGIVLASGIAHVSSCNSVAEVERGALRGRLAKGLLALWEAARHPGPKGDLGKWAPAALQILAIANAMPAVCALRAPVC